MSKTFIPLYLFFILIPYSLSSQVLTGIVKDKATMVPLVGVHVYLNGTSYHTVTDREGKYILNIRDSIQASLIFTHVSYKMILLDRPFGSLHRNVFMEEQVFNLREVDVFPDPFTREQKMEAFRREFLGKDGSLCRIVNEDDIRLEYITGSNILEAFSGSPVVVENNNLGYRLYFMLKDFKIYYRRRSLAPNQIGKTLYSGTSWFIDQRKDDPLLCWKRDQAYRRSSLNFFRHLALGSTEASPFAIIINDSLVSQEDYFSIEDTVSAKKIRLSEHAEWEKRKKQLNTPYEMQVIYQDLLSRKNYRNNIGFLKEHFLVNMHGNHSPIEDILFRGYMAADRIASMLPLDFKPEEGVSNDTEAFSVYVKRMKTRIPESDHPNKAIRQYNRKNKKIRIISCKKAITYRDSLYIFEWIPESGDRYILFKDDLVYLGDPDSGKSTKIFRLQEDLHFPLMINGKIANGIDLKNLHPLCVKQFLIGIWNPEIPLKTNVSKAFEAGMNPKPASREIGVMMIEADLEKSGQNHGLPPGFQKLGNLPKKWQE